MALDPAKLGRGVGKTERVPLKSLVAAQDFVVPSQVAAHREFFADPANNRDPGKPIVFHYQGQTVILDGSHKVLAAMREGLQELDVTDMGEYDPKAAS